MAVEAKRIKERLRALYPKVNLSTKRLDAIAARLAQKPADDAEETAIDQVINDANDFMPFADIAKEDDRVRTLEANQRSQEPTPPQDPPAPQDPPQDPPTDEKMPSWAKAMYDTNKKLLQEVESLKTGKIIETKKATAKKLFDENETLKGLKETVKEKWLNRIDVNSETPIEDQITDLEKEYAELVQVNANSQQVAGAPPNGAVGGKPTDAELKSVADGL